MILPYPWLSQEEICQGAESRLCGQCGWSINEVIEPVKDWSPFWEDGT